MDVTATDPARVFEESRTRLRALAHRMLGSVSEAEDAVQEAWIRLHSVDLDGVENLRGWLTTAVARICLQMLRARRTRRDLLGEDAARAAPIEDAASPEEESLMADSVGVALLVVLDTLEPAERTAFVLHDMFDLSFDEIARIIGRSPVAARQLASRARRRVRSAAAPSTPERAARQRVVDAFIAASRGGDFEALLAVLDPDVVLRADERAVRTAEAKKEQGAPDLGGGEIRGARSVAETLRGRARPQRALVDGDPGAVWIDGGHVRAAWVLRVHEDRITSIEIVMEPEHFAELEIELLDA